MTSPDATHLAQLLFDARELIEAYGDMVERQTGKPYAWSRKVRDDIDAYRIEHGWELV